MSDKRYVGKGWSKTFSNGGSVVNISVKLADLNGLTADKYGDVHLVVGDRKAPDEKTKATHWVAVDEYRHKEGGGF
jgi:hypothetical protein